MEGVIFLLSLLLFTGALLSLVFFQKIQQNKRYVLREDILKEFFFDEDLGKETSVSSLSTHLKVSDSRIQAALKMLQKRGLIISSNGNLRLLEAGRDYALGLIRNHRLYEKYLAEHTGYNKFEWHEMAEKQEHWLRKEDVALLEKQMGYPRFDPHGDPIPTASGDLIKLETIALTNLLVGAMGRIVHIEDEPKESYREILDKGIYLGSLVSVKEQTADSTVFFAENQDFSLSKQAAENIHLSLIDDTEEIEEGLMRLSALSIGKTAKIVSVSSECRGLERRRLLDLGFVKGSRVSVDLISPMQNPKAYLIRDTTIALRNSQAEKILIKLIDDESCG